jgi:hypothetical protein
MKNFHQLLITGITFHSFPIGRQNMRVSGPVIRQGKSDAATAPRERQAPAWPLQNMRVSGVTRLQPPGNAKPQLGRFSTCEFRNS